MKINEILVAVAEMLDIDKKVVSDNTSDEKTLNLLLRALNNVISEISEEYVPFKQEERVLSANGIINFSFFSKRVQKIESVKDLSGNKVNFSVGVNSLSLLNAQDGEYTVKYFYIPDEIGFGDDIDLPIEITQRTLSYGVAGEYALMTERYDESVNYDARFNTAIAIATRGKKERRLPYRGYL